MIVCADSTFNHVRNEGGYRLTVRHDVCCMRCHRRLNDEPEYVSETSRGLCVSFFKYCVECGLKEIENRQEEERKRQEARAHARPDPSIVTRHLADVLREILENAGYTRGEAEPTLHELNVSIRILDKARHVVKQAERLGL